MNQHDLERAVSRATGESVATIRRLGFLLADEPTHAPGEELEVDVLDWDAFSEGQAPAYLTFPRLAFAG